MIELAFPTRSGGLPRDHAFALYAAITSFYQVAHGAGWLALHRWATPRIRLRCPEEHSDALLELSGSKLSVGGRVVLVGNGELVAIRPAETLASSIVHIRLTGNGSAKMDDFNARVEAEIRRQLRVLIGEAPSVVVGERATVRVHGTNGVGRAVAVSGLNEEQSVALQERGIGGKRGMGCGWFDPC